MAKITSFTEDNWKTTYESNENFFCFRNPSGIENMCCMLEELNYV